MKNDVSATPTPPLLFRRKNNLGDGGFGGLQDVQARGIGRCLVQDQGKVVEAHHLLEPAGQAVE